MILGFLKLGFLLEFISIPIITGFISAVAITILLNQMGSLLGSDVSSDGAASQIHDVFANLGGASGLTCAIGFSCIAFLTILDKAGKRWGDKNKIVWLLSILRAFLALVLYTGISYAVNHNLGEDDYLFKVVKVKSNGLETPQIPSMDLVSQTFSKSITVFVGAAIEHTAIARAFGVRNDYIPDQSQELCYFGVCNVGGYSCLSKTLRLRDRFLPLVAFGGMQSLTLLHFPVFQQLFPFHGCRRRHVEDISQFFLQSQVAAVRLCHNRHHPRIYL